MPGDGIGERGRGVIPMSLSQVAEAVGASCAPVDGRLKICRVTTDSRDVQSGDLFVAIRGERGEFEEGRTWIEELLDPVANHLADGRAGPIR